MRQTHLWPEEVIASDGSTTINITIEYPDSDSQLLWYRLPEEYSSLITPSCDPFVVATVQMAMSQSTDLVVHGQVSPSLLQNLTEFQAAWACWRPERYKQIEITAEVEQELPMAESSDKAISAFSGGVDSCFTVFRHRTGRCGRWQRNIQACVMVHGFDIPLEQQPVFDCAFENSRAMLASLELELIPIATNLKKLQREIRLNWLDAYGPAVASSLMLLQGGGYTAGLVGSAFSYHNLMLPRSSNPVTDHFLSSQVFQLVHDGAGFTRGDKIQEIADWSEALQNLRVCWEGAKKDRNCGRCEKCIRTILGFRVAGAGLPGCFEQDVTDQQILKLKGLSRIKLYELELILQDAKAAHLSDSWVRALEKCIVRNRPPTSLKAALKDRLRKLTVGIIR